MKLGHILSLSISSSVNGTGPLSVTSVVRFPTALSIASPTSSSVTPAAFFWASPKPYRGSHVDDHAYAPLRVTGFRCDRLPRRIIPGIVNFCVDHRVRRVGVGDARASVRLTRLFAGSSSPSEMAPKTRNAKKKARKSEEGVLETSDTEEKKEDEIKASAAKTSRKSTKSKPPNASNAPDNKGSPPKSKTSPVAKKARKAAEAVASDDEAEGKSKGSSGKRKKKEKVEPQRITERQVLPKMWTPGEGDGAVFKVISWNVDGLRAVMRNHPTALADLAASHNPDLICLQETKLQEMHVTDPKLKLEGHLLEEEGYDRYWSCSTAKKGYSGTAVFVKRKGGKGKARSAAATASGAESVDKPAKKQATLGTFFASKANETNSKDQENDGKCGSADENCGEIDKNFVPVSVSYGLDKAEHDSEGRIITVDYPLFSLTNLYVPNSGQKLERLGYRTTQWDEDLLRRMQAIENERGVPVIWLGDLNVAHKNLDCWNEGAKHLAKSAGTTPEERASFEKQLDAGYVDAFRHLHPDALGQYTYWSTRAGNREPNKGLRLDYFICSDCLVNKSDGKVAVRDSYILPEQLGSDHCPIVLELEIKDTA